MSRKDCTPPDGADEGPFDLFSLEVEPRPITLYAVGIASGEALGIPRITVGGRGVGETITERFEQYHSDNPHVYATLVRLARRYHRATNETDQSVQRLVEIARWDEKIRTHGAEGFEINNSFRPYYARLIMAQESDLAGIFELRSAPEADAWIAIRRHIDGQAA